MHVCVAGKVECDASVMDGHTLRHGAVGAVPGVRNPVLLARQILDAQSQPLPGGLVPPRLVDSLLFVFQHGLHLKSFPKQYLLLSKHRIFLHQSNSAACGIYKTGLEIC